MIPHHIGQPIPGRLRLHIFLLLEAKPPSFSEGVEALKGSFKILCTWSIVQFSDQLSHCDSTPNSRDWQSTTPFRRYSLYKVLLLLHKEPFLLLGVNMPRPLSRKPLGVCYYFLYSLTNSWRYGVIPLVCTTKIDDLRSRNTYFIRLPQLKKSRLGYRRPKYFRCFFQTSFYTFSFCSASLPLSLLSPVKWNFAKKLRYHDCYVRTMENPMLFTLI